jgi:protein ImuB
MSLRAPQIARARQVQLDLSRNRAASPDALPALLAELSAEIGADRVGVLEPVDAHRPEARSRLVPVPAPSRAKAARAAEAKPARRSSSHASTGPTRLLPQPISLGRIARGAVALVDRQLFTIEEVHFVMRLDGIEWWTPSPVARDYARAWMVSGTTAAEGWVFVDRHTGEGWLQGWSE